MKLSIESTAQLTTISGVPVRVWKGLTESGVECFVFVRRIAVAKVLDSSEFDRELSEQLPPGVLVDLRAVLD